MSRRAEPAAIALLVAVGVLTLAQSWMRWPDPIIDVGRDLYIPEQLRGGARLYADVLYFYPPLTPLLLAAITAVTGSSLAAYAGIGIALIAATAAVLYLLVRAAAGPLASFVAALLFLACSAAGASTYGANYVFPYAHAMPVAMLLFLTAAMLLLRGTATPLALACALAAPWAKIDFIPAVALLLLAAWRGGKVSSRSIAAFVGASVLSMIAAVAVFGAGPLRANVLAPSLLAGEAAGHFYREVSGLAAWPQNLALALAGAAAVGGMVALLHFWARVPRIAGVLALCLLSIAVSIVFFRAWTLLQLALIPFALRRRDDPLPLLLAVSLGATLRVLLNITPDWYGFALIVPLYALAAYVLFAWLPSQGVYERRLARLWLVPLVLIAVTSLREQRERWALKVHPIHTMRGTFYDANPERAAAVNAVLADLGRANVETMVVMPEGLTLNYFAAVRNPTRFHTFTPAESEGVATEREIISELAAKKPERVVIVTRDVSEFGSRGFGIDYHRAITAWLRANYRVHAVSRGSRFQMVVLRR